jgi:hypothetical protein
LAANHGPSQLLAALLQDLLHLLGLLRLVSFDRARDPDGNNSNRCNEDREKNKTAVAEGRHDDLRVCGLTDSRPRDPSLVGAMADDR